MTVPLFQEIHIENTNSCGYKCRMCPRESHTRQIGFMSLEDFALTLERLEPIPWIGPHQGLFHLHGFGEPLLDRQLILKIELLKRKCPSSLSLIYSTLGVKMNEDFFVNLLNAGLRAMVISLYGFNEEDYKKIHGNDGLERVKHNLKLLSEAKKQSPHPFSATIKIPALRLASSLPVAQPPERGEFCTWAKNLGFEIVEWTHVHNYSDGRSYNLPSTERMCPVVDGKRRDILNITWDLNVIPCCFDYNASIPFGNLRHHSLAEIFSSPAYLDFIAAHRSDNLVDYPVCLNCEKNDYS